MCGYVPEYRECGDSGVAESIRDVENYANIENKRKEMEAILNYLRRVVWGCFFGGENLCRGAKKVCNLFVTYDVIIIFTSGRNYDKM